ncbi:MAG: molecular chaperone TorD family protein [Desulfarculaceae bacterium]|nr:molecular chaperone TorD family protein [Desulfarculaceae bacterium]MCF8047288.1 molecular chaperone TorD family protein [Desulfarculaceae bacterium]MCF8123293.1 molecular chaperone TorD family protein [Desulfarculaceae bacterium]
MPPKQPPPWDQETILDGLSLLARLYWGPDQELCQELAGPEGRDLFTRLARLRPDAAPTLRSMQAHLQLAESSQALCEELETAYVATHVNSPQGAGAPLYHSCYVGQGLVMGPPAGAMTLRLEQAGLSLGEKSGEPPDHLSVELEYLIFLLEEGLAGRRDQGASEAGDMARRFMLPWVKEFAQRQDDAPSPLLPLAAKLLVALLEYVAEQAEPENG